MKRWMVGIAAVCLAVGIAGPVAAKVGAPAKASKPVAAKPASPATPAPAAALPAIAPLSHNSGGYPGPRQPKVEVDPYNPRRSRTFKVEVEYFCRRGTVTLDLNPSVSGWPKTMSTDRYGKGKLYVRGGISTTGNYTLTATCSTFTATTNFRIR